MWEKLPMLAPLLTTQFEASMQKSPMTDSLTVLCDSIATPSPITAFGDTDADGDIMFGIIKFSFFKNLVHFFRFLLSPNATNAQAYLSLRIVASSNLPITSSPVTASSRKLIL